MKKDIQIPEAKHIHLVALNEYHPDFDDKVWNIYLWNAGETPIDTIIVVLRGASSHKKTSVIRRNLDHLDPGSYAKLEFLPQELLNFSNEYLLSFFEGNTMYEKNFLIEPGKIKTNNIKSIPDLQLQGICFYK